MKVYKNPSIVHLLLSKNISVFYLRTTFSVMVGRKICKIKF